MLIYLDPTTVLNVDKVRSLMINTVEKVNILTFKYICSVSKVEMTYTSKCETRKPLDSIAKEIIVQLKRYDSTFVDRAFEDAFLKE